jgi:protein-arginine kinase activator protein McsA
VLQTVEKQLETLDASLEENKGRVEVMLDHLKNVQQEITYTESRVRLYCHKCGLNHVSVI